MKKYQHIVQYYETDKMGITHHSNYIRMMEEARIDFFDQLGWGYDKMEEQGIISPVVSINCEYKKTTTFKNTIDIIVNVKQLSRVKMTLEYQLTCNDEIVCESTSSHCFLNEDGKVISVAKQYPQLYQLLKELLVN